MKGGWEIEKGIYGLREIADENSRLGFSVFFFPSPWTKELSIREYQRKKRLSSLTVLGFPQDCLYILVFDL